jgi:hypothetical protein
MKLKILVGAMVGVLTVGGGWLGRSVWRAQRDLVTLHVRNAPLAEVIRQLERQTGERIPCDSRLDTRVTLDLRNKPLSVALDRIAQQCGGRWSTLYAVYRSESALRQLEAALRGDRSRKLEAAGWKTVAPAALAGGPRSGEPLMGAGEPGGPGPGKGLVFTETEDRVMTNGAAHGPGMNTHLPGPSVVRILRTRAGDGGNAVEEEIWSPTEILAEAQLANRLGEAFSRTADATTAEQAARQVQGRWQTYYALQKARFPMDLPGLPRVRMAESSNRVGGEPRPDDAAAEVEASIKRQRLEELGRLTPQQRVERARARREFSGQP